MNVFQNRVKTAGLLLLLGMMAGFFSIASAIDSSEFLTEASASSKQVIISAIFQFLLFFTYMGFAILLYPIIKKFNGGLALGFLSFRIIASVVLLLGTIVLMSILALSQEFAQNASENKIVFEAIGNVLKTSRDYINHVFMVLTLGIGNLMLYFLFLKSRVIPQWLSVWGILGMVLSLYASGLLLFKIIDVISMSYLALNAPISLFEIILGFWLIVNGFEKG